MPAAYNPLQLVNAFYEAGYGINHQGPMGPDGDVYTLFDGRDRVLGARSWSGSLIVTQADFEDGHDWIHASVAWAERDPTYAELALLHRGVFGRTRYAYQVFVPDSEHVNIHAHALHLWGRADGTNVLPQFAPFGSI